MNPGIFYLYEYNNTQKLRNAGFLKITRYYHACTLQLNARGIPVSYADSIKLYVFYMENGQAEAAVLTEITCANHALSARMTSAESQFPSGRPLEKVDGFFLKLPNGHILAAAAPGMTIDAQKLLSASDTSLSEENASASDNAPIPDDMEVQPESPEADIESDPAEAVKETPTRAEPAHDTEALTELSDSAKPSTEEGNSQNDKPTVKLEAESTETEDTSTGTVPATAQGTSTETDSGTIQDTSTETDPATIRDTSEETNSPPEQNTFEKQDSSRQNVRKIQRSELSVLPRKYWHLANNSFLLHGYHNYNHLILVQKDGHFWLGVPGIYDPREARAARLFGFPQFTDSYNKYLRLSDDECDPQGNFGYWCCYLK